MGILQHQFDSAHPDTERDARRRQRTLVALADADAGRLIDDEAMRLWAESLATEHEHPVPQPG